jgi:hypothetical protein
MHVDCCGSATPGEETWLLATWECGAVDVVGEPDECLMTPAAAAAAAQQGR